MILGHMKQLNTPENTDFDLSTFSINKDIMVKYDCRNKKSG